MDRSTRRWANSMPQRGWCLRTPVFSRILGNCTLSAKTFPGLAKRLSRVCNGIQQTWLARRRDWLKLLSVCVIWTTRNKYCARLLKTLGKEQKSTNFGETFITSAVSLKRRSENTNPRRFLPQKKQVISERWRAGTVWPTRVSDG